MIDFDRKTGVGGSDAAAVMGLSPWRSPYDVWMEKTGHPSWRPPEENDAMRFGKLLEPILADEYQLRTGVWLRPHPKVLWAENKIQFAHIDRIRDEDGIWEGKVAIGTWRNWDKGPPIYVEVQVQQYLDITGEPFCDVSVLLPNQFETFRIEADKLVQARIRGEVEAFWHDHVKTGISPPIDGSPMAARFLDDLYRTHDDEVVQIGADDPIAEVARQYALAISNRDQTEHAVAELKNQIKERMGKAAYLETPDYWFSYKRNKDSETVDYAAYANELDALLAAVRPHLRDDIPSDLEAILQGYTDGALLSLHTSSKRGNRPLLVKRKGE